MLKVMERLPSAFILDHRLGRLTQPNASRSICDSWNDLVLHGRGYAIGLMGGACPKIVVRLLLTGGPAPPQALPFPSVSFQRLQFPSKHPFQKFPFLSKSCKKFPRNVTYQRVTRRKRPEKLPGRRYDLVLTLGFDPGASNDAPAASTVAACWEHASRRAALRECRRRGGRRDRTRVHFERFQCVAAESVGVATPSARFQSRPEAVDGRSQQPPWRLRRINCRALRSPAVAPSRPRRRKRAISAPHKLNCVRRLS